MAKSIKFRSFNDGDVTVSFSSVRFRASLREWQKEKKEETGKKPSLEEVYNLIADKVHVSPEAVRNWDKGNNGVNDLQTVKVIAATLGIDYKDLVVSNTDMSSSLIINQNFDPVGNNEKDLLLQIYQLFVDYIYWFCGTWNDSYACHVLEEPTKEQADYIWHLYHYLDQIALIVSKDTYEKLRTTITELNYLALTIRPDVPIIPDIWGKLNPQLESPVFRRLFDSLSDDILSFMYEECDTPDEMDQACHMMIKDIPGTLNKYRDFDIPKDAKIPRDYAKKCESKAFFFYDSIFGDLPTLYEIVVREYANTLIEVMKYRFPQYFEGEKKND